MGIPPFAGPFKGHGKSSLGKAFHKSLIMVFPPDGKGPPGVQGLVGPGKGPAAIQGVISFVCAGMGPPVEVQDNGIKFFVVSCFCRIFNSLDNIFCFHTDPGVRNRPAG